MAVATPIRPERPAPPARDPAIAYLLLRLLTGVDFFGHGYARTFTGTYLPGFAESLQKQMFTAPLSPDVVMAVGYVIPIVELIVGTLLILGLFTRGALVLAFAFMIVLMFGVTLKQDWNAAAQQLVYGVVLFLLLFLRERYDLSWPSLFQVERPHF